MKNKVSHGGILYHKCTNLIDVANLVGPNMMSADKAFKVKYWDSPPVGWLTWNWDVPKFSATNATTISYMNWLYLVGL